MTGLLSLKAYIFTFTFLTSGFVHPFCFDESISSFEGLIFLLLLYFCAEIPVRKQCRPSSDAALCHI